MTAFISTNQLAQIIERPEIVLVDIRPIAAFNGWRLRGEPRGGHIPGAIPFPRKWIRDLQPSALEERLADAGISTDKTLVVYGYEEDDPAPFLQTLRKSGFQNISYYQPGFQAWAADETLPLDRLERYEKLVHPEWINRLINGENPETYPGRGYLLFHVNFGARWEYAHNHLPGARYLDTNVLESEKDWNRRSPEELERALLDLGITSNTTVVLYGRDSRPTMKDQHPGRKAGQIAATRAAMILMYAGVKDVRLLDGGYDAWVSAGYPVEKQANLPSRVGSFGVPIPQNPQYIVDLEEAKEILADPQGELVSIRSWHEFTGETSGYHYIGPRGRIAGAIWGNCGSDAYHMQNYRNYDNTMRNYHKIEANWSEVGITPEKRIAFYCGTGWRASETFFYAYLMGWERMAVYDGGWLEWSADPSNPVETGVPAFAHEKTAPLERIPATPLVSSVH